MANLLGINYLCRPAYVYFILSMIFIIIYALVISSNGIDSSSITMTAIFGLIMKILFIGLWIWFLNFLCRSGFTSLAWFLVIFPYIVIILILSIVFMVLLKTDPPPTSPPTN